MPPKKGSSTPANANAENSNSPSPSKKNNKKKNSSAIASPANSPSPTPADVSASPPQLSPTPQPSSLLSASIASAQSAPTPTISTTSSAAAAVPSPVSSPPSVASSLLTHSVPISIAKRPSVTGLRGSSAAASVLSRSPAKSFEETMYDRPPVAVTSPPASSAALLDTGKDAEKSTSANSAEVGSGEAGSKPAGGKMKEAYILKAQKKAEKAARRQAAAAAAGGGSGPSGAQGEGGSSAASPVASVTGTPAAAPAPTLPAEAENKRKQSQSGNAAGSVGNRLPLLSHLSQLEKNSAALEDLRAQRNVHPAIISLGVQFSEFLIAGGSARCLAMLAAFKKVISDYSTPQGTSLQRHLTSHIGKQIDYLVLTRSLADSMKTAIRNLKSEITNVSIDLADEDAKEYLKDWIDDFIKEKITVAASAIVFHAMEKIRDWRCYFNFLPFHLILCRSSVVESLLLAAHEKGISFRVIVSDSRPKLEGRVMLKRLAAAGISCTYVLTNALGAVMTKATKLIFGAAAVLSNGAVMSRVGTAVVAMMAHDANIPVMVLCEQYKFTEIVRLDSFVWNEIGDPDELVETRSRSSPPLPSSLMHSAASGESDAKEPILRGWRDIPDLKLLHLYYDVTPASYITLVVCENGCLPSTSVLSVLANVDKENKFK
ncbi:hypothetical protein DFJ73DRAFT_826262 [Zopfochytrium polystomum]|nr:hypothetical protein DFJ73DRAFT_826262 [Zopfochytrium polystomum]